MYEYNNRKPKMGIVSFKCIETGESFLEKSKDTRVVFNSTKAKLTMSGHPNKRLQELWIKYGESGFELSVIKVIEYEDMKDDYTLDLELTLEECLENDPKAMKLWK